MTTVTVSPVTGRSLQLTSGMTTPCFASTPVDSTRGSEQTTGRTTSAAGEPSSRARSATLPRPFRNCLIDGGLRNLRLGVPLYLPGGLVDFAEDSGPAMTMTDEITAGGELGQVAPSPPRYPGIWKGRARKANARCPGQQA